MILLAPALASPALFSIKLPALAGSAAGFAAITPIGAAGPRAPKAAIASQPPIVLLPNAGTGLFAKVQIQIIIPSEPENAFTVLGGNLRKKAIRANTAEYYRPGREYSYSGKCAGSINTAACDSALKLGGSWHVLENSANLPGLCKKQPSGFYVLGDWGCEDGNRDVGYPKSYTSSGVTKMWCNTGTLKAVKGSVSCTKSTKNC